MPKKERKAIGAKKSVITKDQLQDLFGRRYKKPGKVFTDILKRDGRIVAPGLYNAYGAKALRMNYTGRMEAKSPCEYNAAYLGGWAVSAMLWGRPDMGFHDRSMMVLLGKYIIPQAWPLPVIMDAETGFCQEPVTIAEIVEDYHRIGVALAHLEDQATRRCGNLGGKACIPAEDMVVKIRAWLAASYELGTSMRLMVRTDALTAAGGGLDDAIDRMKRYMDTEYKGLRPLVSWADAMMKPADLEKWLTALHKHDPDMVCGLNYSPNKPWTGYYRDTLKREPPTYDELVAMGFKVIWHTIIQARADQESTWRLFSEMADHGAKAHWDLHDRQQGFPYGDPQAMSNFQPWQAFDLFIGGDAASARYEKSQGYGKK